MILRHAESAIAASSHVERCPGSIDNEGSWSIGLVMSVFREDFEG
jgi:hypothetical protein